MCWRCVLRPAWRKIGLSDDEAAIIEGHEGYWKAQDLLTLFAGPNGRALLEVYRIRKGKK